MRKYVQFRFIEETAALPSLSLNSGPYDHEVILVRVSYTKPYKLIPVGMYWYCSLYVQKLLPFHFTRALLKIFGFLI